jgi:hypothetical protein
LVDTILYFFVAHLPISYFTLLASFIRVGDIFN